MSHMLRLVLVLFGACFIAAGSLAGVNELTKKPINGHAVKGKTEAMRAVQPEATSFRETVPNRVWDALRGDRVIGRVINTEIQGYGLGARVTDPVFLAQFKGQPAAGLILKKGGGGGGRALAGTLYTFPPAEEKKNEPGVDAITGATISSRAVTNGIIGGMKTPDAAGEEKQ